jgi:hypothetical protein
MGELHGFDESRTDYYGHSVETLKTAYGPDFRTITPQGYLLQDCRPDDPPPEYGHYFCGPHDVAGAVCPNCDKPLLRLLAIDTRDPRLGLTYCPFDTLSLFFCMTCEIAVNDFYYQLQAPDGRVKILMYGKGKSEPDDIPFSPEPYPLYFPGVPVRLVPLSRQQQWYIIEHERLGHESASIDPREEERKTSAQQQFQAFCERHHSLEPSAHQIGGYPELVQGWRGCATQCPVCGERMAFLAMFWDESTGPRGFVGNSAAQFTFTWCAECLVVGTSCLE